VLQRELAVVRAKGVIGNIRNEHRSSQVGRGSTRAGVGTNRASINGTPKTFGQTGRCCVVQSGPVVVEEENRTEQPWSLLLKQAADNRQGVFEGGAATQIRENGSVDGQPGVRHLRG